MKAPDRSPQRSILNFLHKLKFDWRAGRRWRGTWCQSWLGGGATRLAAIYSCFCCSAVVRLFHVGIIAYFFQFQIDNNATLNLVSMYFDYLKIKKIIFSLMWYQDGKNCMVWKVAVPSLRPSHRFFSTMVMVSTWLVCHLNSFIGASRPL